MSGRHRHAVDVRTDGLATVLGPLSGDPRVRAAALVDVDSGMVLDSCGPDAGTGDAEGRGAAHAELVRTALSLATGSEACEVVVQAADGSRHVLQPVADPHGDRLALVVVVQGSSWVLSRVRRQLRAVSAAALTAGPSTALRPTPDGWQPGRLRQAGPAGTAGPGGRADARDEGSGASAEPVAPRFVPLWIPDDHVAGPDGPTVPALVGIPRPAAEPLPQRTPGSAWTAPPAPATPVDVERGEPADDGAARVSGQRRPAPPSALPPGSTRPAGDDGLSRPRAGPA